jgi:hypothetical protein
VDLKGEVQNIAVHVFSDINELAQQFLVRHRYPPAITNTGNLIRGAPVRLKAETQVKIEAALLRTQVDASRTYVRTLIQTIRALREKQDHLQELQCQRAKVKQHSALLGNVHIESCASACI